MIFHFHLDSTDQLDIKATANEFICAKESHQYIYLQTYSFFLGHSILNTIKSDWHINILIEYINWEFREIIESNYPEMLLLG